MSSGFKYWAFISYSHQDKKWGDWLHNALETYKLPKALVGGQTERGEPVPERAYPIFRDRDELPTSADLGDMIRRALERSRYLVVICSPRSAQSRWVNQEILEFKRLGRKNRILAVIVEGEPNATDGKPGFEPKTECFPPALRFKLDSLGQLSSERTEPIAADVRDHADGKFNSRLKLLAGIVGVNYDDLKRRDDARRRKRQRTIIAASLASVLTFATLAGVALWQWKIANRQRNLAEQRKQLAEQQKQQLQVAFSKTDFNTALDKLDRQQDAEAIAYLARALRTAPVNKDAASLLFSILSSHNWFVPEFQRVFGPENQKEQILAFDNNSRRVITQSTNHSIRVWDLVTGQALSPSIPNDTLVSSAIFHPTTNAILTVSQNVAKIWDVTSGQPTSESLKHDDQLTKASFDPTGTRVVTVSDDRTARIWDASSGEPLLPPIKHDEAVRGASFSPDGKHVLIYAGETARVWDATTGQPISAPMQHHGISRIPNPTAEQLQSGMPFDAGIASARFSPDGTRIVTASLGKTARVWNAVTGEPISPPLQHESSVLSASFSPDGATVITEAYQDTARLWNAADGELIPTPTRLWGLLNATSAFFSPDGARNAAIADKTVRVWDAATEVLSAPMRHLSFVDEVHFTTGRYSIVTFVRPDTVQFWNAPPTQAAFTILVHTSSVPAAFSSDGHSILTASSNIARVYDASTGQPVGPPIQNEGAIWHASFSPNGRRIVTTSTDHTARVWDATTAKPVSPPIKHNELIYFASFSPDGAFLATASHQTARVWDASTGQPISAPMQHDSDIVSASFSHDGLRIVTASLDDTARVWEASTGKPLSPPMRHERDVLTAVFSPDGKYVLTASRDDTARVWDAATGDAVSAPMTAEGPTGHEPHAEASFSPNGRRVVTAFGDGTVRVWDAISGQPISATMKHSGPVNSAAFSPDGSRIVTAGNDGTARIWNADTGSPISPLLEHAGPLNRASFSPDGNYILTSSADAPTKLWPLCKEMGPSWVLDLAETLAQCRVDDTGNPAFYRGKPLEGLRQLSADESNKTHPMVLWAKGLLKRDPL